MIEPLQQKLGLLLPSDSPLDFFWEHLKTDPRFLKDDSLLKAVSLLEKLEKLQLDHDHILGSLFFILSIPPVLPKNIQAHFSKALAIHEVLQKLGQLVPNLKKSNQPDLFLKMLIATAGEVRVLSSLLAIRLETLERIHSESGELKHLFAKETLSVYAPLAERLGIFWIKSELEDLSLRYTDSDIYYELKKQVAKKRHERSSLVESLSREIQDYMIFHQIPCQVYGRYKRFYSIYRKLKKVDYDFSRIQDLIAFRILTDHVEDCYKALGYVHEKWKPKKGRIKDYIDAPKPNGYQSLHTTVLTETGETIEIQIRTHEMHQIAEFGVAAHWLYKAQSQESGKDQGFYNQLIQQNHSSSEEDHEDSEGGGATQDPFQGLVQKIYIFTPQSEVMELPQGASPIDFAYAIHTELGNHVIGARLNGKIAKLDTPLSNGDRVEVVTSPKQTPREEWLQFVKTARARSKIRYSIHLQEREAFRRKGWEKLEKLFRKNQLNLNRISREGELDRMIQKHRHQSTDAVLFQIGEGTTRPEEVLGWFVPLEETPVPIKVLPPLLPKGKISLDELVVAGGISNIQLRFAKCCDPAESSQLMGYITHGYGISVHTFNCASFERMDSRRKIEIYWTPKT